MSEPLGLIGVGLLGGAIADRLGERGFRVLAFDLDPAKLAGRDAAASAADVAHRCREIILSLPDSDAVDAVVASMLDQLSDRHLVIDTTTGDPSRVEAVAARLAERGALHLDATILGSSAMARRGAATALVGGSPAAVSNAEDVLTLIAARTFHLGPSGAGSRMKLVVNLVLGLNRAALAEGLSFARKLGVDAAVALEVLAAGAAYSRVMDAKGPKMLAGDFAPEARLRQHLKDVDLILAVAAASGATTPLSAVHRELLASLAAAGHGDEDNAAIIRAFG